MTPPAFWTTPPRTFLGAIDRQARDAQAGERITVEVVQGVRENGRAVVLGVELPTAGPARLQAGQRVHVAWREGRPSVILATVVRRAQFTDLPTSAPVGTGLVEELFLAPFDPQTPGSALDVWFRNDRQVVCLNVRSFLSGTPEYVKWSVDGRALFVRFATVKYAVFTLNRTGEQAFGSELPTATLLRIEDALASNLRLLDVSVAVSRSGRSLYTKTQVQDGPTGFDPVIFLGATVYKDLPLTASASFAFSIRLDHTFGDRQYIFDTPLQVGVYLEDVHLDDNRDIIAVVRVNLPQCISRVPLTLPNQSHDGQRVKLIPVVSTDYFECSEALEAFEDVTHDYAALPTSMGTWPMLINVTQGTVLWSSLADPVILTSEAVHYILVANYAEVQTIQPPDEPGVVTTCTLRGVRPGEDSWTQPGSGPFVLGEFSLDAYVDGDVAKTASVVRHDRLPFIPAEATWFHEHVSPTPTGIPPGFNAKYLTDYGGPFPGSLEVTWNVGGRLITNDRWGAKTLYIPRRPLTPGGPVPLGQLVMGITRTGNANYVPTQDQFGVFLLDLANSSWDTIMPLTSVNAAASFGADELCDVDNGSRAKPFWFGANLHRLLWRREYVTPSPGLVPVDEILVTRFPPPAPLVTRVVGPTKLTPGDPFRRVVVENTMRVLRPDFMYYASDTAPRGNQFLLDHNAAGDLLLDNSASEYPPVDPQLKALGALLELPAGVTPKPQQIVEDQELLPGPSYLVINDSTLLTPFGRFIADPPG